MERGKQLADKGAYPDAEKEFRAALALGQFAAQDPRRAATLGNLGSVAYEVGDHRTAESALRQALSLWEAAVGSNDVRLAPVLINLAAVYVAQRRYRLAETFNRRTLDVLRSASNPDNDAIASTLNNLATIHEGRRDYVKAEDLYNQVLSAQPLYSERTAVALHNLGVVHAKQGHMKEAAAYLDRALALATEMHLTSLRTKTLLQIGIVKTRAGSFDAAESTFRAAIDGLNESFGTKSSTHIDVFRSYAVLLRKMKRRADARHFDEKARSMRNEDQGRVAPHTVDVREFGR